MALQGTDFFNIVRGVSQAAVEGSERGRRNALADQQLVEREQVKNALAEFTMPDAPQEQRDAALNTLLELDPATAADAQQFDITRSQIEADELIGNAREGIAQTDFIRDSEDPVTALELLDEDGALRSTAAELGLDATNPEDVVTLSRLFESQYTQFIDATENDLARKLATVRANLPEGRELSGEEIVAIAGGAAGTTINVGETSVMDEPIPIPQLGNLRHPDTNEPPEIGTTPRQAADRGFVASTAAERASAEKTASATNVLDELETIAFGDLDPETGERSGGGLFADSEPGLFNRAVAAANAGIDMVTQNDPGASRFNDLAQGTLSPIVKALGEAGALAEGDVARASRLIPKLFPLKDTTEVAQGKFDALRRLLTRGSSNRQRMDNGQRPDLTPVLTEDEWAELEALGEENDDAPQGADIAATAADAAAAVADAVPIAFESVEAFTRDIGNRGLTELQNFDIDDIPTGAAGLEMLNALDERLRALGR